MRSTIGRAQIKPRQCCQACTINRRAIKQHNFTQRPRITFEQGRHVAHLGNAEPRCLGIFAQQVTDMTAIGKD